MVPGGLCGHPTQQSWLNPADKDSLLGSSVQDSDRCKPQGPQGSYVTGFTNSPFPSWIFRDSMRKNILQSWMIILWRVTSFVPFPLCPTTDPGYYIQALCVLFRGKIFGFLGLLLFDLTSSPHNKSSCLLLLFEVLLSCLHSYLHFFIPYTFLSFLCWSALGMSKKKITSNTPVPTDFEFSFHSKFSALFNKSSSLTLRVIILMKVIGKWAGHWFWNKIKIKFSSPSTKRISFVLFPQQWLYSNLVCYIQRENRLRETKIGETVNCPWCWSIIFAFIYP